ncbi:MAG TPA: SIS domain-containing protein, partial [Geminicoccaceae bacterium]|nr:SIS domain-containing protein [Geminicoccaceae bacterium]
MTAAALHEISQISDPASTALAAGRRVLRIEAEALEALAAALDERFEHCVEQLARTRGRVVVTGMGKSGHVARKIAATFASTGTPSLYVHPAEASHGDLGMITSDDVVLALSNSGETPELADIVAHSRRFAIPLLAIVGRTLSSLAETAALVLTLPQRPEACPMGLAPTTSTTATLALGDALAIALLERRGFGTHEYSVLALSNSGETPELADIVAHSRRFSIPLVAMVGRPGSSLAETADVILLLPQRPEACPMGLAPTTSTTAMLALGDALAVALLERRGFGTQDFSLLHPGGKLGKKLVRVDQLMHAGADLPLVGLDTRMSEVMLEMTAKRLGCVGVVD